MHQQAIGGIMGVLRELKCRSCGSSDLTKLPNERYQCTHCGCNLIHDSAKGFLSVEFWECPKCGTRTEKTMEFCGACGADLKKDCPSCNSKIQQQHEFCPKCGVNILQKLNEIAVRNENERRKQKKLRLDREKQERQIRKEAEKKTLRKKLWWKQNKQKLYGTFLLLFIGIVAVSYLNSDAYAYKKAEKLYEKGLLEEASIAFNELGNYRNSMEQLNAIRYEVADSIYETGSPQDAVMAFDSLGSYSDSQERSLSIRYEIADALYESDTLFAAVIAFEELGSFSDSQERSLTIRYEIAETRYEAGNYLGAASAFAALGHYRDSYAREWESLQLKWEGCTFAKDGVIISDFANSLQWRVGPDRDMDWEEARSWVNGLGSDWRMPSRRELLALNNAGIGYDNWGLFQNGGQNVWSGETRSDSRAWAYDFFLSMEITRAKTGFLAGFTKRAFAVRSRLIIDSSEWH